MNNKFNDIKEQYHKHWMNIRAGNPNFDWRILHDDIWNFFEQALKEQRKEIEGIVDIVLGYIEDEKEYKAAKSRWETLKSK